MLSIKIAAHISELKDKSAFNIFSFNGINFDATKRQTAKTHLHTPNVDTLVEGAGGQESAVRTKCNTVHRFPVPVQLLSAGTRLHVP